MWQQFKGSDSKAQVRVASGDYSSAVSTQGRRLIEKIRYLLCKDKSAEQFANRLLHVSARFAIQFVNHALTFKCIVRIWTSGGLSVV